MVSAPSRISISVFLPCYNEQGNIERVTGRALHILGQISDDYEVIIVDDGSSDDTGPIAESLAARNPHVKVVHHQTNQGYGAALQSGFRAATKQWVFYTDGDGQFDIAELAGLLELTVDFDIVSCYRIDRQDSRMRRANAWAWGRLIRWLFRLKVRDIDCAFKLYRREIFHRIEMHSTGALIDTEILARAQRAGFSIVQKGVHHYPRTSGAQTGANIKVIFRAFVELLKLRKRILSD